MSKGNVVLIGMPGAGKSTIGVILAKTLRKPFVDTDLLIQQRENKLLQEIIDLNGIKQFLEIEEDIVLGLKEENHVIATGGSVIYSFKAINFLKGRGTLVYLQLKFHEIERRIRNITTRGIAINPEQRLSDLYDERVALYEKYADITINCSNRNAEEIISEIKAKLGL